MYEGRAGHIADAHHLPAEELATLLKVSRNLVASLELSVVLQVAVESTVEVLGLDTGAIYLIDDGALYLGATTPPLPPDFPEEYRHADLNAHPHAKGALESGQPVMMPDFLQAELTPEERGVGESRNLRTVLFVPLLVREEPVGVVIVGTTDSLRDFTAADVDLCRTLSYQVALAVANARLFRDVQRANAETQRVNAALEATVARRTGELATANEELQHQAAELLSQAERLREATLAKSAFLASMSHELRTPLNSVIGFSGILAQGRAGELTAEQHTQVEMINRSGRHLLHLIDQVLDLARIEAGRTEIAHDVFDPAEMVVEVAEMLRPMADDKSVELRVLVPAEVEELHTDCGKTRQILLNIVGNAVKFTDAGFVEVVLERPGDGVAAFSVTDTGPGIDRENQDHVFDAFTQFETGGEAKPRGTGLGLSISREYAQMLGGAITVQSELGRGSTFTLTLPDRG